MEGKNTTYSRNERGMLFTICMALLVGTLPVLAFDLSFDIQPRALRVGEAATATLTIMGVENPPTPQFPDIPGLQISYAGAGQNFMVENGVASRSVSFRYQVFPTRTGKFNVGPFTYQAGKEVAQIPAVEIEVIDAGQQAQGDQPTQLSDLLFARVSLDRSTIYNQQVFGITFSIYSRGLNLARDISLLNQPPSGFTISSFQELAASREVVNNQVYDVRRFRGKAQALTAGSFKLAPAFRVPVIVPRENRRSRGMFDDFFENPFFNPVETRPIDIQADAVEVVIRPLPTEGQPSQFSGAVGRFTFDVQAKPLDLNVGDPVTLNMLIAGEGNLEAVAAPRFPGGDRFKLYDAKLAAKEIDDATSSGRKLFEQVVIPKSDDIRELPPLTFAFFNPETEHYETITRGPFPLTVHPSASGQARLMQAADEQSQAQTVLLGSDIVYLKPSPAEWTPSTGSWAARKSFLFVQSLPVLCVVGLGFIHRRRRELSGNIAKARRLQAPRSAQTAVRKAEEALSKGQRADFYEALWEAIASYFGNRLNLSAGQISRDQVHNVLTRGGLDSSEIEFLDRLFDTCDRERFTSGSHSDTTLPEKDREPCSDLLDQLSRTLKTCEKIRL